MSTRDVCLQSSVCFSLHNSSWKRRKKKHRRYYVTSRFTLMINTTSYSENRAQPSLKLEKNDVVLQTHINIILTSLLLPFFTKCTPVQISFAILNISSPQVIYYFGSSSVRVATLTCHTGNKSSDKPKITLYELTNYFSLQKSLSS